jgi:hypothetical protein
MKIDVMDIVRTGNVMRTLREAEKIQILWNIVKQWKTKEGIECINHYDLSLEALYSFLFCEREHTFTEQVSFSDAEYCAFSFSCLHLSPPFPLILVHAYSYREFQYTVWNANGIDTPHHVLDKDKDR